MTFERFGLCSRFANCFVCCEMCQDEMRIHAGDVGGNIGGNTGSYQYSPLPEDSCIMVGKVPIGGGGCTPTVELFERINPNPITPEMDAFDKFGVLEGPTCFGGCYDFCCDTTFYVSNTSGARDVATLTKKKPGWNCNDCCKAACTPADTYNMVLQPGGLEWPPEKRAMLLANLVHLDYMFFEEDRFPITCERKEGGDSNSGTMIRILCCLCYCYGCLCPIECCLFIPDKQN